MDEVSMLCWMKGLFFIPGGLSGGCIACYYVVRPSSSDGTFVEAIMHVI